MLTPLVMIMPKSSFTKDSDIFWQVLLLRPTGILISLQSAFAPEHAMTALDDMSENT